jgi:hypothetical protein
MSDQQSSNKPSHIAYQVRESEDGKAFFNRVGSAFQHKDGKGYNLELDAVPVNGRVVLRTPKERLEEKRNGAGREERRERRSSRDRYD